MLGVTSFRQQCSGCQHKYDLWHFKILSRLIWESLDNNKTQWNVTFANQNQTPCGVDMRWDSFPISTEASQSGLSDRSHRVSKSGFFARLAAHPQIQRDRSALKWRPAELFGRKTQRAAPKYISCPATWRCDRLESEMMDLFFDLLESRVTTVCSELMSLPQHTHTHTRTHADRSVVSGQSLSEAPSTHLIVEQSLRPLHTHTHTHTHPSLMRELRTLWSTILQLYETDNQRSQQMEEDAEVRRHTEFRKSPHRFFFFLFLSFSHYLWENLQHSPTTLPTDVVVDICQCMAPNTALYTQFKLSPALRETLLDGFVDVCLRHHIIIITTKNV